MLFENLVSLIDGELLNQPSISSFLDIVFDAKKVKIGSLFFGNAKEIDLALKNGAYGIVCDKIRVKDKEIAWIRVKDIDVSKVKLLRYFIIHHDSYIVSFDSVEVELSKMLYHDRDILYIDDIQKAIKELDTTKRYKVIIIANNKLFKKLDLSQFDIILKNVLTIHKSTNFLSTFTYNEKLYKDVKFPSLFKDSLERVLNCFDNFEIEYRLEKISFINHFKPLFVDKDFRLLNFGQSRRVFIAEKDESFFKQEIDYLLKNSSWAKIAILLPKNSKIQLDNNLDIFSYQNYNDILKFNLFKYNFIFILDKYMGFEEYLTNLHSDFSNTLF